MCRHCCKRNLEADKNGVEYNQVLGGSTPIHSVLLRGTDHFRDGLDHAQDLDFLLRVRRYSTGIDTVSVSREPEAPPDAGSVICLYISVGPHLGWA